MEGPHYVYQLTDPRCGSVFYVGKGQNDRLNQHVRDAQKDGPRYNPAKTARIREIMAAGKIVIAEIIARYEDQEDALDYEEQLIATLPGLTNIARRGSPYTLLSAEEIAARVERREEEVRRKRWVKLDKWLQWANSLPNGSIFPDLPDGDRKAAEFIEQVNWMVETSRQRFAPDDTGDYLLELGKVDEYGTASGSRA